MSLREVWTWEARKAKEGLLFRDEVFAIQGAVFNVYREMGCGFLEAVYQECMERELTRRQIPYRVHPELRLRYRGEHLEQVYRPDFICYDAIIVEIKAVRTTAPEHAAQLLNYLKVTGIRLGLLANIGSHPRATVKRFVL